jgi:hypothetical protein
MREKRIFSTFVGVRRQAKERKKEVNCQKLECIQEDLFSRQKNDDGGVLSIVNMLGMDTQKNGDRLRKNLLG